MNKLSSRIVAWFLAAWVASFVQPAVAQSVTYVVAPRVVTYGGVDYSSSMALCNAKATASGATAINGVLCMSPGGTTGSAPDYNYYTMYCLAARDSTKTSCGQSSSLIADTPSRKCVTGTLVKGPVAGHPEAQLSGESYCPQPETCKAMDYGSRQVLTAYTTGKADGSAIAKKIVPDGGIANVRFCEPKDATTGCVVAVSGAPTACGSGASPGAGGYYAIYCTVPMARTTSECTLGNADSAPAGSGALPPMGSIPSIPAAKMPGEIGACPTGSIATGKDAQGYTVCTGTTAAPVTKSISTQAPAVTVTNADGSKTTTQATTTTNADGSSTTTTQTTKVGTDGTTAVTMDSVTGAKPNGEQGEKEDKNNLCKLNPALNICKNSQVIGNCEEITCQGDAIACAALKAAAIMECRDKKDRADADASPLKVVGEAAVAGTDKAGLPSVDKATVIDAPTSLDSSGWLGGGAQCFTDKTFTVHGQSIVIPFSKACDYLVALRYALMVVAALASFKIVSGAVLT